MTTSDSGDAILSRLATRNDGETTTVATLAQWLASGECPPYVIRSAAWSILDLVTKPEGWAASGLVQVAHTLHHSLDEHFDAGRNLNTYDRNYADKLRPSRELQKQTRIKLNSVSDVVKAHYIGPLVSRSGGLSPTDEAFTITIRIPDLLTFWNGLPVDDRPRDGFPLEILYVAWLNRPQLVTPNARATGRIIPAKLAHVSPAGRQTVHDGGPRGPHCAGNQRRNGPAGLLRFSAAHYAAAAVHPPRIQRIHGNWALSATGVVRPGRCARDQPGASGTVVTEAVCGISPGSAAGLTRFLHASGHAGHAPPDAELAVPQPAQAPAQRVLAPSDGGI
jgi:hypothetical protein